MATGASTASLAITLIDASKGLLPQGTRHSLICSLLGIRHIVLAVKKMDLIGFDADRYAAIVDAYTDFAAKLNFADIGAIPLGARMGDNVTSASGSRRRYQGPSMLQHLEEMDMESDGTGQPFRSSVQWVNRPDANCRGYADTVVSGQIKTGQNIRVARSGHKARVQRIITADGDLAEANAGQAVTLALDEKTDIARGDMLVAPDAPPETTDQFAADILWLRADPMLPGRDYLLRTGQDWTQARITSLRHRVDVNSGDHVAARTLQINDLGLCRLATLKPTAFDKYNENRANGAVILVDRFTHETVAAGMIHHALRRASNIHCADFNIDRTARTERNGQHPLLLWFTGLSGSGNSTIADLVEQALFAAGRHCYSLDGDNIRISLCRDLGFTAADHVENIRRAAEVARLMMGAGLIVLASFISPFWADRQMLRELVGAEEFLEIHVDASIETCMQRHPKGLYAKAKAGLIPHFTGLGSPYEAPEHPDNRLKTGECTADQCAEQALHMPRAKGIAC